MNNHNSVETTKEIGGSSYICKFSFFQQQMGCFIRVAGVVEVDQGAVEYQVDLQFFTVRHFHKVLVL